MLNRLAPDLWETNYSHRVLGVLLGRRLTVVRLSDGGLWVHASLPPTPELLGALDALGSVRHIIGPNCVHDAYLREFTEALTTATFHAAPGLTAANRSLRADTDLTADAPPAWAGVLEQHLVAGLPKLNEVVFFHRSSRTLILADLAFNLGPPAPLITRTVLKFYGVWDHFGPSRLVRALIRDREAFQASIIRILQWDFDRIIVGHGRIIETGGKDVFRRAFFTT